VTVRLAAFHRSRQMNRTAVKQKLFGQCGLARVGVRYDRKRPAGPDLVGQCLRLGHSVSSLEKSQTTFYYTSKAPESQSPWLWHHHKGDAGLPRFQLSYSFHE